MEREKKIALAVNKLTVMYHDEPVLWDICVEIPVGSLLAVIGPNGAGKTTFIKAIVGLLKPVAGTISILENAYVPSCRQIAYVPQKMSVDWDFPISVQEVVMMGRYGKLGWFARPGIQDKEMVKHALRQVDLEIYADTVIGALSGGQQQRVFFARALAQQAEIYIFDEPFAHIDGATEYALVNILQQLVNEGKTVIVVHHDLHTVRTYFKTALLLNVKKIAYGTVDQVVNQYYLSQAYGKKTMVFDDNGDNNGIDNSGTICMNNYDSDSKEGE